MKNTKWLIIGAVVIGGYYFWYKNKNKKTNSTGATDTSTGATDTSTSASEDSATM